MKYSREKITIVVVDAICEQTGVHRANLDAYQKLREDLGFDSLDEVEIAMAIEDELSIELPDEVVENCKTVQDVIDAVFNICGEEA